MHAGLHAAGACAQLCMAWLWCMWISGIGWHASAVPTPVFHACTVAHTAEPRAQSSQVCVRVQAPHAKKRCCPTARQTQTEFLPVASTSLRIVSRQPVCHLSLYWIQHSRRVAAVPGSVLLVMCLLPACLDCRSVALLLVRGCHVPVWFTCITCVMCAVACRRVLQAVCSPVL